MSSNEIVANCLARRLGRRIHNASADKITFYLKLAPDQQEPAEAGS